MPRTIKIDFYKTQDSDGNALDVADLIVRAFHLPLAARRVEQGDSFVCLHNVRRQHHDVMGQVLRAKMTDLPDKVSRNRGLPEDLGLQADEGIGHRAHFYYDSANQVLLIQRHREVRAGAFVSGVATPTNSVFTLALIFKRDALARLNRMRVLRKIAFTVASPAGAQAIEGLDPSAAHAIELLGDSGGRRVEISISVGKARKVGLERNNVLRMARWLFAHRGEEVQKVIISGRENPDASTEIIDLFEDRLVHDAQLEERERRMDQRVLDNILMAAHQENLDYLRAYRNLE